MCIRECVFENCFCLKVGVKPFDFVRFLIYENQGSRISSRKPQDDGLVITRVRQQKVTRRQTQRLHFKFSCWRNNLARCLFCTCSLSPRDQRLILAMRAPRASKLTGPSRNQNDSLNHLLHCNAQPLLCKSDSM